MKSSPLSPLAPGRRPRRRHAVLLSKYDDESQFTQMNDEIDDHIESQNIEVIKAKCKRDKMRKERDEARKRGRLLEKRIDDVQRQLRMYRKLVAKQKKHNKKTICKIISKCDPRRKELGPMASLIAAGEPRRALDEKPRHTKPPLECVGNYSIGVFLGEGAFGKVYSCTHSETRKGFAIKTFDKKVVSESSRNMMLEIKREAKVMQELNHPNIIKAHTFKETPTHFCLVLDLGFMDLQSWVEYQWREDYDIEHWTIGEIALGIVRAIKHLHDHGIAHLDIKASNILVTEDVLPDELTREHIKLSDFGLCAVGNESVEESGIRGTYGHQAPEMAGEGNYDACAADMFSLGYTLLGLVQKVPEEWCDIYEDIHSNKEVFQKRMRVLLMAMHCDDKYFDGIPIGNRNFIRGLLAYEPKKRLTAAQVLEHCFVEY